MAVATVVEVDSVADEAAIAEGAAVDVVRKMPFREME